MNDKISFANDAITFNRFTIKIKKTMPFWSTEPLLKTLVIQDLISP
jgi:hypothetical protein